MSFLAPFFLLGALAIAGPVLFHLIRRTTREKVPFSSLLFLRPDPPRLTQRSRIEHWLLLLLRAAALALLAFAFARPFIRAAFPSMPSPSPGRRIVLLMDQSASMQRHGLAGSANDKARALLQSAQPGDQLALWTFSATPRRLIDFAQWNALPPESRAPAAQALLTTSKPDWSATHLATALMSAAEMLAETAPANTGSGGEIILISDFQDGSKTEGLQGWEWPRNVQVTLTPVTPTPPGNAGLQLAPDLSGITAAGDRGTRVRVWNAQDSTTEQFQLGWAAIDGASFIGKAQDLYVPPGQLRVVHLPAPAGPPAPLKILLRGDEEPFDNTLYTTPPVTAEVFLFYFGAESPTDTRQPLFFLDRALPQDHQLKTTVTAVAPDTPPPSLLPGQSVGFIVNGSLPPLQSTFLHAQLTSGITVLLSLTGQASATTLTALAGLAEGTVPLAEIHPANYGMLSQIDFQHPLFAPFADPRFSDFTKIRIWNYRRLDPVALPGSRILARFDSGDPALLEMPVGAGRLLILATGWHPHDSQLALSSKFAPLLSSFLEWGGIIPGPPAPFHAGQRVNLAQLGFANDSAVTVQHPDGTLTNVPAASGGYLEANQPGVYRATAGGLRRDFAVNPDPRESHTAPMGSDELERLGVPLKSVRPNAKQEDSASAGPAMESESRQKLWRWIIAAAFIVLVVETLLAGHSARHIPTGGAIV